MRKVPEAPAGERRRGELERLYREQGDRMWRAVLAFAGDPEVASDAVAEASTCSARLTRQGGALLWAEGLESASVAR